MANELRRRYGTFTHRLLRSQFRPEQSSTSLAAAIRRDRREINRQELRFDAYAKPPYGALVEADLPRNRFPRGASAR